ncbi:hypothetical protein CDO36_28305, partial [Pseudomonas aeruginosa]
MRSHFLNKSYWAFYRLKCRLEKLYSIRDMEYPAPQCHQPKLQPCPRQAPRSSQPPWPSGDDQASAAQSGGLAGLA